MKTSRQTLGDFIRIVGLAFAGLIINSTGLAQANGNNSAESLELLQRLRKEYQTDQIALDQINQTKEEILEKNKGQKNPRSGPEWSKAVHAWLPLFQKAEVSYQKYLNALVQAYCDLPFAGEQAKELGNEIAKQHPAHSKYSLTVSYYNRHSLLANAIMPHLHHQDLEKERAEFFSRLLKPNANTKIEDLFHSFRLPAEPQDWSVQAAYSLACLRAGEISTARKENKKLIRKGARFAQLDKEETRFNKGDREELKMLLVHRALIEAHDGKVKEARKYLSQADENLPFQQLNQNSAKLVEEIEDILGRAKK